MKSLGSSPAIISGKNTKEQKLLLRRVIKNWQLYVFLFIPVVYLIIFKYYPMFGVQIAFKRFNPSDGIWGSPWAGLRYFQKFFTSYQFSRILPNTIILSLYSLAAGFPIPIILALAMNTLRSQKYKEFVQTVTYMPHFISTVVLVGMIIQVFNPRIGVFGTIYQTLMNAPAPDILGKASIFRHIYVWSGIWQGMGWNSIIYMAALSSVDLELHEASQIDGANRFQRVLYIDFPAILPTAAIMLILNAGNIMSIGFEKVFLLQNNLNLQTSEVISTYVYKVGLASGGGDFSYATAIGLFNSVVNLLLLVIVNTLSKRLSSTSLW